jgi:hypothetical protein
MEQNIQEIQTFIEKVKKVQKKQGNIYSSFSFLPWFIVFFCLYIIIMYLIKIETNSLDNWDTGKCSSKYVFFSGFMNNEGEDPLQKSLDNFQECVKRFL